MRALNSFLYPALVLALTSILSACGREATSGLQLVYELHDLGTSTPRSFQERRTATIEVVRKRVEGARVEPEGERGMRVALPWSASAGESTLAAPLSAEATSLELAIKDDALPKRGGLVCVDREIVRYSKRAGTRLLDLERAVHGTPATSHAEGAHVRSVSVAVERGRIESIGRIEFKIQMLEEDFEALSTREERERDALHSWVRDHADATTLTAFNALSKEAGGPTSGVWWAAHRTEPLALERATAVTVPKRPEWVFSARDLHKVTAWRDHLGYPAVRFELVPSRRDDFGDWTESHINHLLAIVIDERVMTMANIKSRLPGGGIIERGSRGGYTADQVADIAALLSGGELLLRPVLKSVRPFAR
jgi:preprotein translocase subunit SecD